MKSDGKDINGKDLYDALIEEVKDFDPNIIKFEYDKRSMVSRW